MFPSPSPSLHPSPSLPLLKISQQTGKLLLHLLHVCQRMSILSLFISFCLHRPLSHLLYSLHRGESTHLPSCRATPLPSISSYSPLGGDWYQHPPSFLSSLSTPSTIYTLSPPLSLLRWHPLFLALYLCLPLWSSVFNRHLFLFFYLDIKVIVYALAYKLLIKMHYVCKHRTHSLLE